MTTSGNTLCRFYSSVRPHTALTRFFFSVPGPDCGGGGGGGGGGAGPSNIGGGGGGTNSRKAAASPAADAAPPPPPATPGLCPGLRVAYMNPGLAALRILWCW